MLMNVTMELIIAALTAIASTQMVVSCVFVTLDGVETVLYAKLNSFTCIVMQEASDALTKTADSDTVSTYQVSSVQLVTDKKLEAFNKA